MTDWLGTVNIESVEETVDVRYVLSNDPVGWSFDMFCRYVCKCAGKNASDVSSNFECEWTLEGVAAGAGSFLLEVQALVAKAIRGLGSSSPSQVQVA